MSSFFLPFQSLFTINPNLLLIVALKDYKLPFLTSFSNFMTSNCSSMPTFFSRNENCEKLTVSSQSSNAFFSYSNPVSMLFLGLNPKEYHYFPTNKRWWCLFPRSIVTSSFFCFGLSFSFWSLKHCFGCILSIPWIWIVMSIELCFDFGCIWFISRRRPWRTNNIMRKIPISVRRIRISMILEGIDTVWVVTAWKVLL